MRSGELCPENGQISAILVGEIQRYSERNLSAKYYVDASILKGRTFVKL